MNSLSIKTIRCPKCYLIPKIIYSYFNEFFENSFSITILCLNNHLKRIYTKKIKDIFISLNEIPCTNCSIKEISQYYCKECYAILCDKCKDIHILNLNHNNIKTINELDNICLNHNEKYSLYCLFCEIDICIQCLKDKDINVRN